MRHSILTSDMRECFFCKRPREAVHHIYYGTALRKISDKHNFIVPLCRECHTGTPHGVHHNRERDLKLKQACQREYEKTHTREEFRALIGKSYL